MKPRIVSERCEIFRNEFLRLYSVKAQFDHVTKEYFVTEKGTRVGAIILRDGHVLLVRQYRFLINGYSWELPGGGVQPDETFEEAIVRECREEAGLVCHSLSHFYDYLLGTDVSDSPVHLFTCSDFSTGDGIGDRQETDAQEWVSLADCMQRIWRREIQDSMTILALMAYTCRNAGI